MSRRTRRKLLAATQPMCSLYKISTKTLSYTLKHTQLHTHPRRSWCGGHCRFGHHMHRHVCVRHRTYNRGCTWGTERLNNRVLWAGALLLHNVCASVQIYIYEMLECLLLYNQCIERNIYKNVHHHTQTQTHTGYLSDTHNYSNRQIETWTASAIGHIPNLTPKNQQEHDHNSHTPGHEQLTGAWQQDVAPLPTTNLPPSTTKIRHPTWNLDA